ncbi:MAG: mechanosensitive ion channel domain-containing protein, partial [Bacteroidota bacterium]
MEITGPDPAHLFLRFIGWSVALFLFIRLLRFLLPVLFYKEKPRLFIFKVFPVAELLFWLIYLSWFVFLFSEAKEIYVFVVLAILLMVLFWISRFWIKDLIAGVIFRSSTRLKAGDMLHFGEITGTIKKFGNYSVELETQDNQTVFIPYGKLVDDVNIKSERTGQSKGYTFSLECSRKEELNAVMQQIRSTIFSTPWVSVTRM